MFDYLYSFFPAWPTFLTWNRTDENLPTSLENMPEGAACNVAQINFVAKSLLSPQTDGETAPEAPDNMLQGSYVISHNNSGSLGIDVVVDAEFYNRQSDLLLQSIHEEEKAILSSGEQGPSLTASFLDELKKVVKSPTVIIGSKDLPIWGDLLPMEDEKRGAVEHPAVQKYAFSSQPLEEVAIPLAFATCPPPPSGRPPIRAAIVPATNNSQATLHEQIVKAAIQKRAAYNPESWAMDQEISKLEKTIKSLMHEHQENPIFLIKYPALINSFLKGMEESSSMDELTESQQFNVETAEKIVSFHAKFCSDSGVKEKLKTLLKDSMLEYQKLAAIQKKKSREAVSAFAQSRAIGKAVAHQEANAK
jgi:hypothetical protein